MNELQSDANKQAHEQDKSFPPLNCICRDDDTKNPFASVTPYAISIPAISPALCISDPTRSFSILSHETSDGLSALSSDR